MLLFFAIGGYALSMIPNKKWQIFTETIFPTSQESGGYDIRFDLYTDDGNDELILGKIQKSILQLKLLQFLENEHISQCEKLEVIQQYQNEIGGSPSKYVVNMTSGGLYNDWDFPL